MKIASLCNETPTHKILFCVCFTMWLPPILNEIFFFLDTVGTALHP